MTYRLCPPHMAFRVIMAMTEGVCLTWNMLRCGLL